MILGGQLVATVQGTGTSAALYPVHADHLTGSSVVTNGAGAKAEVLDYHPFGSIRLDERSGTFSPTNDPKFAPHAECWCYGKISDVEKLTNGITGNAFYHFTMAALAANYDLGDEPETGGIIGGTFRTCAKHVFDAL